MENYIKLYNHLSKSLNNLYNYEKIYNIINIKYKKILKNIIQFINEDNILNKFKLLISIYDNIPKNEMLLKYRNEKGYDDKVSIFGKNFVKNNKDNCYIVIEGKKYNIQEKCPIQIKNEMFEVKLVEKRKICEHGYR